MKKIRGTSYQSGRLRRHFFPLVVWVGTLTGIFFMFQHRTQSFEVVGFAQGQMRQIAATRTGEVKAIRVDLFEEVEAGDILAELNDEQHKIQLASAHTEIAKLGAQLTATEQQLMTQINLNDRTFAVDVERANIRILELQANIETDELMLKNIELELAKVKRLVSEGNLFQPDLDEVESRKSLLEQKIAGTQKSLAVEKQNLAKAKERCDKFLAQNKQDPELERLLAPIRLAIEVQQQRVQEINIEGKALVLRSPFHGVVSQILARPGETILPGEPVVTIAERDPRIIIAYLPEERIHDVYETMEVEVVKNSNPPRKARASIKRIGPAIETKPEMYWRHPNIPERGRPCMIAVNADLHLIPGEKVGIRGL